VPQGLTSASCFSSLVAPIAQRSFSRATFSDVRSRTLSGCRWQADMLMRSLLLLVSVGLIGGPVEAASIRSDEPNGDVRDRIKEAWMARQEKLRTARFSWTAKTLVPKGSLLRPRNSGGEPRRKIPEEDAYQVGTGGLLIGGDKVLYYSRDPMWSHVLGKFIDREYKTNRLPDRICLFFSDIGNDGLARVHPLAIIQGAERGPSFFNSTLPRPFLLYMRPLSFEFSKWENWRVANSAIIVDGRNCVALEWSHGENCERFYVDSEHDYVIVRNESSTKNRVSFREDINYKYDKEFGWIPMSWSSTLYRAEDGHVRTAGRAVLLEFAFNREISDAEFDFELPEGTEVQDER
jgi:hypothetical protein